MQKRKGLFTQRSGTPAFINLECKQALTPPPKLSEIFKTCSAFYFISLASDENHFIRNIE